MDPTQISSKQDPSGSKFSVLTNFNIFGSGSKGEVPQLISNWESFLTRAEEILCSHKGYREFANGAIQSALNYSKMVGMIYESIGTLSQVPYDKNELYQRAIAGIMAHDKIVVTYYDQFKSILTDLITNIDATEKEFAVSKDVRKKYNQQCSELRNSLSKVEQATKNIMGSSMKGVLNASFFKVNPKEIFSAQCEARASQISEQKMFDTLVEQYFQNIARIHYTFVAHQVKLLADMYNKLLQTYKEISKHIPSVREMEKEIVEFKSKQKDPADLLRDRLKKEEEYRVFHKYTRLTELMCQEGFILLQCIGSCSEEDTIPTVVKILDAHGMAMPVIRRCIIQEVAETKDPSTLFRGNSVSTKLMSAFTKMTGEKYLNSIIIETLSKLAESGLSYEIDPVKKEPNDDIDENQFRLIQACQDFLDLCILSIDSVPIPFRIMANTLESEVMKRFPKSTNHAIAGLMFLRFFCPALSTFDSKTVWPGGLPKYAKRGAVLMGKIIQTLANGQRFGAKESYLQNANDFLDSNTDRTIAYLNEVAITSSEATLLIVPTADYEPLCSREACDSVESKKLHLFLVKNLEKIGHKLVADPNAAEGSNEIFYSLMTTLGDLGDVDQEIEPYTPVMVAYKDKKNKDKDKKDKDKDKDTK